LAPDNTWKHLRLALVSALVNEKTGRPLSPPGPEIAFPAPNPDEAETVEPDIAVVATSDVPERTDSQ
jgi:hypothetical protein